MACPRAWPRLAYPQSTIAFYRPRAGRHTSARSDRRHSHAAAPFVVATRKGEAQVSSAWSGR
eukprot:451371-Pleurochrysis_carterae.AAC.1